MLAFGRDSAYGIYFDVSIRLNFKWCLGYGCYTTRMISVLALSDMSVELGLSGRYGLLCELFLRDGIKFFSEFHNYQSDRVKRERSLRYINGLRRAAKLPLRGQRTRSNANSVRSVF